MGAQTDFSASVFSFSFKDNCNVLTVLSTEKHLLITVGELDREACKSMTVNIGKNQGMHELQETHELAVKLVLLMKWQESALLVPCFPFLSCILKLCALEPLTGSDIAGWW